MRPKFDRTQSLSKMNKRASGLQRRVLELDSEALARFDYCRFNGNCILPRAHDLFCFALRLSSETDLRMVATELASGSAIMCSRRIGEFVG
jgi:hypothetical protein